MAKVVGVRFKNAGKIYYFDPANKQYRKGCGVIEETARGAEYGVIAFEPKDIEEDKVVQPLKPILRAATASDEENVRNNEAKVAAAIKTANEKIAARKLNMKLISAEYNFDNSKVVFYFSSSNRVDFRDLVKDLASALHTRIELRQVGIRDEARILGGIARCGRECCCSTCMPDFRKVTIKMAKTQGLSLNPAKISGLCGRLMCCLEYESNHYSETFKLMPKVGSEVMTPDGKAVVMGNNMLKLLVRTKLETTDGSLVYKEYKLSDIKVKKANRMEDLAETAQEEKAMKDLLD